MGQSLKNNYLKLLDEIGQATLIAVTKKRSLEEIRELCDLGQRDFGENRVDELLEKSEDLNDLDINWHFIGNLQSKKIPQLLNVNNLTHIHSIDRLKLINLLGENLYSGQIFLQVNISGEKEKSGFIDFEQTQEAFELAMSKGLKVAGLMGMAGIRVDDQQLAAQEQFTALRNMRDRLDQNLDLSIGMSTDFKQALKSGANYLRIGSLLFS